MIVFGLDLGQALDYTALCAVDKRLVQDKDYLVKRDLLETRADPMDGMIKEYHVRHVERFPLGTSYPKMITMLDDRINALNLAGKYMCVPDATGVGRPVVDMLRKNGITCTPVSITGGEKEVFDEVFGGWRVPKRILVSTLQVLLQNKQLKFAANMPHVDQIINELANFKVKVTESKNDTYEAWREGDHDDLVLALALAAWYAVRFTTTEEEQRQPVQASPWLKVKGL